MKKLIFFIGSICFLLVNNHPVFSQTVSGTVYGLEEGRKMPLPGVNILWENSRRGTTSDSQGFFSLERHNGFTKLVFSFVGYETVVLQVGGDDPVEVLLQPSLEIEEVRVTRKNRGSYISSINPVHTEHINGAELHKAACCNLAESFETNPSVDVSYNDAISGAKQIRMLGLDGIYTQLLTDNIPNFRGLSTNFGLTYIPGPWMESIQVGKGSSSVIQGYESVTGQINVAFKKPDSDEKLHLNLFSSADGKLELNANTNLRLNSEKLTTAIFVHSENFENRIDHNQDGFLDHPLTRQTHLYNVWKYNNKEGLMVHGALRYLDDTRTGGQINLVRGLPSSGQEAYKTGIKNQLGEAVFKIGYVWPSQRTALAFLSNGITHNLGSSYGLTDYDATENRFYSNLVLTSDLDHHSHHVINAGIGFLYDSFRENLEERKMKRKESVPGIFAEYTLKPSDKLTLMAGIRSDFHNNFGTFLTPRTHFRYQPDSRITFRASAGKGYRTAHVLAENSFLLSNFRMLDFTESLQEEAWNYGASIVQNYKVLQRDLQITAEFYRTDFKQHLLVDRESSDEFIILTPSTDTYYANSYQVDLRYQIIANLDLTLAYRINDVKETIAGKLLGKPYLSRYKGLVSMNYTTKLKKWMFDYTAQFNGGGRLPEIAGSLPGSVYESLPSEFPSYTVMNAQVTRYFRLWSIYAGAENLTDFVQDKPVLGADHPFEKGFDATNIWGPVMGRRIYAGIRFTLNYNE